MLLPEPHHDEIMTPKSFTARYIVIVLLLLAPPVWAQQAWLMTYGTAERVSSSQVAKYFLSRPKESQLAAWASEQSRPVSTRQALMQKFAEIKHKFEHGEIPLPSFWGGFLVRPHKIEFWQGGEHRLHDRFMYNRQSDNSWSIERLCP